MEFTFNWNVGLRRRLRMLDTILEKLKSFFSSRLLPISIVYVVLFGILVHRIFTLQIVENGTSLETTVLKNTQTREIKSTRGNIYDRNGVLLAYNELSYSVVIEDNSSISSNEERNQIISNLIHLIEENGDEVDVDFPIALEEDGSFSFQVSGTALTRFRKTAYTYLMKGDTLPEELKNTTAQEVFEFLRYGDGTTTTMFNISEEYSTKEALQIMAIRYAIFSNYPKYLQITVATQVSDATVAAVKENARNLPGVNIKQDSYRVYNDSEYFSHIMGYTGKISSDELIKMQESGLDYNSTDYVGKSGMEQKFETYLSGTKGSETVTVNNLNKVVSIDEIVDPVAGNDLYLTIDADLQKAAYHVLENKIAAILLENIVNSMNYGTKGESASDIKIPIYEVYYALINNNVIDITRFQDEDATNLERAVYSKYQEAFEVAMNDIKLALAPDFTKTKTELSDDLQDYLSYIYQSLLLGKGLLVNSSIDKDDSMYTDFINHKISLSQFVQYAIANNWMDLSKLSIGSEYYSTDEIYQRVTDYVCNLLVSDSSFNKKIYKNLVFSYKLSGKEICLLLFEQGVLEYNEEDIFRLENNQISPYTFLTNKIRNLEITPAQLALDPCSGSVVVTDPDTGEVLAMVTYPSYDNNKMANKVDAQYYEKLRTDLASPMLNRTTMSKSAPGSTFKMVTSIAGLSEGVMGVNETVTDLVSFSKLSHTQAPKCWSKVSHGKEDVVRALRDSCNYYFYEMGWRLGGGSMGNYNSTVTISVLRKYASLFGLDEKTGIEIGEAAPEISDADGIRSSIGQGTNNFAPIHLSRYVSTIANGGDLYNLTLLDKISDKDGNVIIDNKLEPIRTLDTINRVYWNAVVQGMYSVVNDGSIKSLFSDLPVKVAGKTGTAQESTSKPNHALFVSFAPYDNPEVSITAVIRNGYASANAVEVASELYEYYFGNLTLQEILNDGASLNNNSITTD